MKLHGLRPRTHDAASTLLRAAHHHKAFESAWRRHDEIAISTSLAKLSLCEQIYVVRNVGSLSLGSRSRALRDAPDLATNAAARLSALVLLSSIDAFDISGPLLDPGHDDIEVAREAERLLTSVVRTDRHDGLAWWGLIVTGRLLGISEEELIDRFERCVGDHPAATAVIEIATAVGPRSHGCVEAVKRVSDRLVERHAYSASAHVGRLIEHLEPLLEASEPANYSTKHRVDIFIRNCEQLEASPDGFERAYLANLLAVLACLCGLERTAAVHLDGLARTHNFITEPWEVAGPALRVIDHYRKLYPLSAPASRNGS